MTGVKKLTNPKRIIYMYTSHIKLQRNGLVPCGHYFKCHRYGTGTALEFDLVHFFWKKQQEQNIIGIIIKLDASGFLIGTNNLLHYFDRGCYKYF